MENLLHPFTTKYNSAPFSQIKMSDYKPAFEATIKAARAEIEAIKIK